MFASGNRNKNTAKFNGLKRIKAAALSASVAVLLAACSSSGDTQPGEFTFEGVADDGVSESYQPAEAPETGTEAEPEVEVQVNEPEGPEVLRIRDDAPERYTVKKGDTLWDLANQYLENPWQWPELWYFNPQIVNPHLIYPGDVLVMSYIGDRPQLRAVRGEDGKIAYQPESSGKVTKMEPRVRSMSIDQAIPSVSLSAIGPFLASARVLTREQIEEMPRIVGSLDNRLISASDTKIYARGVEESDNQRYQILRPGRVFADPDSGEILGYEAIEVGEARLVEFEANAELSTFQITQSKREVLKSDRLMPAEGGSRIYSFVPAAPEVSVEGEIIGLHNAISNVATNEVFIVNLGARDGVEAGNIVAIDQAGAIVREPIPGTTRSRRVQLPKVRAGLGIVFRVFDRVSYVLIVDSNRAINVGDQIRNPEIARDY